jgi:hypothetical protein
MDALGNWAMGHDLAVVAELFRNHAREMEQRDMWTCINSVGRLGNIK